MSTADAIREARVDLAAAYRLAVLHGLNEGIDNHFTLALPGRNDRFLVIPYGLHWSEVTANNLIVVDLDGHRVEGEGTIEPTAFYIHGRIHRGRTDARCVLHVHMPYATALTSVEGGRLAMSTQNALPFHGRVAYDDHYNGLALDDAEGDRVVATLGDKDVLFMANHGITVVGPSVADAYDTLYYLERACQNQVLAASLGQPLKILPDPFVAEVSARMRVSGHNRQTHFDALKRLLDRTQPDYRK
jgi:ribulose-5-phosphate 4-epimerase/fuculose-1-phosphate aldolase